ncbi:MAG: hypothetical protein E7035_05655 [Verrucomicrobiaceae bacterium]|nr:hypothetical protein [Verrucomicrobiaceae bacterium]
MKKISLLTTLIVASASIAFAEDMISSAAPLTSAGNTDGTNTGVLEAGGQYTVGSDGVIITHNRTSARHIDKMTLNVGAYKGTQLVSDAVVSGSGNYFGLNGVKFIGSTNEADITIQATERATSVGLMVNGFTVDNVTLDIQLSGKSHYTHGSTKWIVKNNGILKFEGANTATTNKVSLDIESGSVAELKFDGSGVNHLASSTIAGQLVFKRAGSLNVYGTNYITGQTASKATLFGGRWDLVGNGVSMTIEDSEENSVLFRYGNEADKKLIMRNSTLTLNSSNAIGIRKDDGTIMGQENISLEIGQYEGTPSTAELILGADNSLGNIHIDSNANSKLYITLNGNRLDLNGLSTALIGTIYISDFEEELICFQNIDEKFLDPNYEISCIKSGNADSNTALYWDSATGYITANIPAVPEPATFAVIFGALALSFVAYRKRK